MALKAKTRVYLIISLLIIILSTFLLLTLRQDLIYKYLIDPKIASDIRKSSNASEWVLHEDKNLGITIKTPQKWRVYPTKLNTNEHYTLVVESPEYHKGPMSGFLIQTYNDKNAENIQVWRLLDDQEIDTININGKEVFTIKDRIYIFPNPSSPIKINKYNHFSIDHSELVKGEMDELLEKILNTIMISDS